MINKNEILPDLVLLFYKVKCRILLDIHGINRAKLPITEASDATWSVDLDFSVFFNACVVDVVQKTWIVFVEMSENQKNY